MKKITALFVCLLAFSIAGSAQEVSKVTFVYSVKGVDTLRLDRYAVPGDDARPCLVFMFGGGFYAGVRDEARYLGYFDHFARNGFVVASIDYRRGFKPYADGVLSADGMKAQDFLGVFENTINMAVEDLFDATNFILSNADEWGVDPGMIITSGSSAGAISVLQGEYERANRSALAECLPEDFRYAGVMAFAGAVYSNSGHLKWSSEPAPLLMFHGDADVNVPYGKKKIFRFGLFGSEYLAKRYDKNDFPYWFYSEENIDHKVAVSPMTDNLEDMMSFIRKYVFEGRKLQSETVVSSPDLPKAKKRFGIKDYIRANFTE